MMPLDMDDVANVDAEPDPAPATRGLIPSIETSLRAKLERVLRRPVIAPVVVPSALLPPDDAEEQEGEGQDEAEDELPEAFRAMQAVVRTSAPAVSRPRRESVWREDARDGTVRVCIAIDYDDLWRGAEKEVLEAVTGTVEGHVTFLTDEQHRLLVRSPREFLELQPKPESAELVAFKTAFVGGVERVVELTLAAGPETPALVHHVAIVPNLIPLERQLAGVHAVEGARPDGPLAPLRALLGLDKGAVLAGTDAAPSSPASFEGLDESQAACVRKALETPHFAVIKGPPGSGKTTVISTILRHALERGQRVLVVSPTHVAVDNVVEKLAPKAEHKGKDTIERRSLPVRYSAKTSKLSKIAFAYWVGPKKERRGAAIAKRVERALRASVPIADELFDAVDADAFGLAPISAAVASVHAVICGTPIGILSYRPVKEAEPAAFDLLIVDEVSKMTLPEFIAIAVKARRWILVGDPEQLPPYNSAEENGETLDDLIPPVVELACSVGAVLEKVKPELRPHQRLVVVASNPNAAADCVFTQLEAVKLESGDVATLDDAEGAPIVVCSREELPKALELLSPARGRDRTHTPDHVGTVPILVERGISVPRPAFASGARLIEARARAQVRVYETAFNVYHAQPWAVRTGHRLWLVEDRRGLEKFLPSEAALHLALPGKTAEELARVRQALIDRIADRFAVNAVSVYDWLTGIPTRDFDVSPLRELGGVASRLESLREQVRPYVGTLRRQYRMHSSLSRIPREHFYFGEALDDGKAPGRGSRVGLVQVYAEGGQGEVNEAEATAIGELLQKLNAADGSKERAPHILIITPYKKQERHLAKLVEQEQTSGGLQHLQVEVCTLDRCQGREAEYVFISLVRNRASAFLDAPKRWNVALTRAMEGLFIFGDIEAYLREAAAARTGAAQRPLSLLARLMEAYHRHNTAGALPAGRSR